MDKNQLKDYLRNLDLHPNMEKLLFELVDGAPEVNEELLDVVADILEIQAEMHEKLADIYEEEAEIYEKLAEDIDQIDKETMQERLDAVTELQEELVNDLSAKLEELKSKDTTKKQVEDQDELAKLRNTLQQAATG